ncbi:MAG: hypothetical protein FWB96_10390 [Defluviitaleaceae bacterium]|nr:hypothetical protein [Defluviitaleaceae bacterium]MCL2263659.1 hypothetical protein [Defluviitaleaceae bacterium]MCL2263892.1 hypothetical protein [Defluviitaleaceae bacterium]MCL2264150.1 hypothetical protein [Defluviitaleaceae bacterium]
MNNLFPCPCCGNHTLEDIGEFDICDVCMWEDDPMQREDPNDSVGANKQSLNDYKADWLARNPQQPPVHKTAYAAAV